MNAHRMGSAYGLSVKDLGWGHSYSGIHQSQVVRQVTAKVVGDELFIETYKREQYPRDVYFDNRYRSESSNGPPQFLESRCAHGGLATLDKGEAEPLAGVFLRCSGCRTETLYMATHDNGKIDLETWAWYNLGECRDPRDDQWELVCGCGPSYDCEVVNITSSAGTCKALFENAP